MLETVFAFVLLVFGLALTGAALAMLARVAPMSIGIVFGMLRVPLQLLGSCLLILCSLPIVCVSALCSLWRHGEIRIPE